MADATVEHDVGAEVRTTLEEMGDYLKSSADRQKEFQLWSRVLTFAIILAVVLYIILFYQTFRKNLAPENFTTSFQKQIAELVPVVSEAAMEVLTEVTPVYAQLAGKQVEASMPEILEAVDNEANRYVLRITDFAEGQLHARMTNISNKVAAEFKKEYPDLTDAQLEQFIIESETAFEDMFVEVAEHIINQSLPEIMEMKSLTEDMVESKKLPKESLELHRLFLHKLLLLLDMEIMEGARYVEE